MRRAKVIPPELRSELDRLLKCAYHAHLTGDHVTKDSCQLRYADLYRRLGAQRSPTPQTILTERQAARHRTVHEVPLWRVRQRLVPLVAIVRVEEVRFRSPSGHESNYWIEHLSCGHTQNYYDPAWEYSARSKRRKCKQCGDAAMIAAGYIGDLARDHKADPLSTAAFTRTVPAGDDTQFTFSMRPAPAVPVKPRVVAMLKPATPTIGPGPENSAAVLAANDRRNRG